MIGELSGSLMYGTSYTIYWCPFKEAPSPYLHIQLKWCKYCASILENAMLNEQMDKICLRGPKKYLLNNYIWELFRIFTLSHQNFICKFIFHLKMYHEQYNINKYYFISVFPFITYSKYIVSKKCTTWELWVQFNSGTYWGLWSGR